MLEICLKIALEQASIQNTDVPVSKLVSSQFIELIKDFPDVGNHALIKLYRGSVN